MTETDNISNGVNDINLSAVVFEANLVGNPKEWWVDTGATRHICADKKCSHLILQWTMVNNFLWATPQLPKLKDKGRLFSR